MISEHDLALRAAAFERVRELQRLFDDLIPVSALREGFAFAGERVSLGSFYSGIFKPRQMEGAAALVLITAPPKAGKQPPYEDTIDEDTGEFVYRFRDARTDTPQAELAAAADNASLEAAYATAAPLVHFRGLFPGQYSAVFPVFLTELNRAERSVRFQVGLPVADLTPAGPVSSEDTRRYATREAVVRLHQHRFRVAVLSAYSTKCAVCSLREQALLQASHIIGDTEAAGAATVVNGISLCAIHHLAYDRNLMGIDPAGVVHIHKRLLAEIDGPMLANGLQHFHGAAILQPKATAERPDPERLEVRFDRFKGAA